MIFLSFLLFSPLFSTHPIFLTYNNPPFLLFLFSFTPHPTMMVLLSLLSLVVFSLLWSSYFPLLSTVPPVHLLPASFLLSPLFAFSIMVSLLFVLIRHLSTFPPLCYSIVVIKRGRDGSISHPPISLWIHAGNQITRRPSLRRTHPLCCWIPEIIAIHASYRRRCTTAAPNKLSYP